MTDRLPPAVAEYLTRHAAQGDAYAAELLRSTSPSPAKGDVIYDEAREEALLWDANATGESGWWSAREGEFVLPSEQSTNLVVHGQLVHAVFGAQSESEEDDAEKVAAAYTLFNAVEWALAQWELAERKVNPRTSAQYLQPVPGVRTINELVQAFEAAREAYADPTP